MFFAASNTGADEVLEAKYNIMPDMEAPQYRLFLSGSDVPVVKSDDISTVFHIILWVSLLGGMGHSGNGFYSKEGI